MAEHLFGEAHSRDSRGRCGVRLPVGPEHPRVANETGSMALKSLSGMQRRLSRDARLAEAYGSFMRDYERLGHMTRVPALEIRREDQDLQRGVWATIADAGPVDYRLNAVACGTTCAPYLAIRTLSQLVIDEGVDFPLGAVV
ncbi:uncharacterized protein LOC124185061 [Neodiprion fabricii]|uniref:uncharacterized protein LOC124185061 n=1 Tax=Neodiprion fabricii TaxID=2872261 RepID=UPI001ED9215C|nr:uncharacterized protein LOC124185061 [Neodiprion fabricii]